MNTKGIQKDVAQNVLPKNKRIGAIPLVIGTPLKRLQRLLAAASFQP
jgi:hypothetical protein